MDALIETHDEAEMARAAASGGDLVGINNRSLRTFEVDLDATARLAPHAPRPDALLVAESGDLHRPTDVRPIVTRRPAPGAILVGESLMRQAGSSRRRRGRLLGRTSTAVAVKLTLGKNTYRTSATVHDLF